MKLEINKQYNRWTALKFVRKIGSQHYYLCRCSCGTETEVNGRNVLRGLSKSCGCLHSELTIARNKTHGQSSRNNESKVYQCWINMRARCLYPSTAGYADYGGRGIKVCERWNTFENFLEDMGGPPFGMELNRIDNDKDYCKENCEWTTLTLNIRNRRNSKYVEFEGSKVYLKDLARKMKVNYFTLYKRIYYKNETPEQAVKYLSPSYSHANLQPIIDEMSK